MLNIYFWIYGIIQVLRQASVGYHYSPWLYYLFISITTGLLIAFSYSNNLYLLPRFVKNKKRPSYLYAMIALVAVFSIAHTLVLKSILYYFPDIKTSQISIISAPLSKDWSVYRIIKEIPGYTIIYSFWGLIFTMAWYMTHYLHQEKIIEQTKKEQIETELSFLKSQINPHFLFNNLNNLYALAIKKSDKTPEIILKLSSLLRYLLYESNVGEISFEKEKEIIEAYIDLELLRLSSIENFHFTITSDKAYKIPPLLWLPILENVFKHGARFISDNNYIDYSFRIENNVIEIYSKNLFKTPTK